MGQLASWPSGRDMAKAKAVAATAAAAAKDTKAVGQQLTLKKNAQGHLALET